MKSLTAIGQTRSTSTQEENHERKRLDRGVPLWVSVRFYHKRFLKRKNTHEADEMSSTWLLRATKRSKNSWVPPLNISSCMVPLRLKVERERMMSAR